MSQPSAGSRFGGRPMGRRGLLALAVIALAAVVVVGAVYLYAQGQLPGQQRDPQVVAEFNGDGDLTTDSFTVSEGWEITWQNQGSHFEMALSNGSTRTLMSRDVPGSGTTVPRGSGTYRLVITAQGLWTVKVTQP